MAGFQMSINGRFWVSTEGPSSRNWANLAEQVVTDYLSTDPPMFRDNDEIIVGLPEQWPGSFSGDHRTSYHYVDWAELTKLANDRNEVEFIRIDWGVSGVLALHFSVSSSMAFREHPKILRVYGGERHCRFLRCKPQFSSWQCEIIPCDA
jgi:hypothetical protein